MTSTVCRLVQAAVLVSAVGLWLGGPTQGTSQAEIGRHADIQADNARALGARGPSPAEVYLRQCAACHGATGKGDGPAAVAFNPRPADFTDPELFKARADADLVKAIADGVGKMPAFGKQLAPSMVLDLVKYVRSLSAS